MNGIHTVYEFQLWVILLYMFGWLLTIVAVIGVSWDQYRMRDRVEALERRQATQKKASGPKYPRLMPKQDTDKPPVKPEKPEKPPEKPAYVGKHSA